MMMVAALIMGAAIRPRPFCVKENRQITGFHGAGTTR
ncbi:hypothetical protein FBZ93_101199 [Bradyrhizobium macuxiense]|uniref:Uncharacterized protein n=1 Tax=Bradyrhizobium macuxiense TaxID=1755647 RepID=A0A560MHQ9_9BRAD|nr:hypothetical protein FBZ93_101199 [Bradyrhizobium macuxiense]